MKSRRERRIGDLDWLTIFLYLALVVIGWFSIYSAAYNEDFPSMFDFSQRYGKQFVWIAFAFVLAVVILFVDAKFFNAFAYWIYGLVLLTLVGVLLFGAISKGARSWISIGSIRFQPSEFAKFATALALGSYLGGIDTDLTKTKTKIRAYIIIFLPALLILAQNDTGSAMVFLSFVIALYREGMSGLIFIVGIIAVALFILTLSIPKIFVIVGLAVLFAILLFIYIKNKKKHLAQMIAVFAAMFVFVFAVDFVFHNVFKEHQRTRIEVLLGLKEDIQGAGYNVNQSKIAIGSGGFSGKGFLEGTQTKYDFVPEQSTDFIFCTIGEEMGFVGTAGIIVLYLILIVRIIMLAERQRSPFSRVYGYGIAGVLFFHVAINVGMTIGLMPVIGIPLPFVSFGGSSLWAFTIMLFVFLKQDANRLNIL